MYEHMISACESVSWTLTAWGGFAMSPVKNRLCFHFNHCRQQESLLSACQDQRESSSSQ